MNWKLRFTSVRSRQTFWFLFGAIAPLLIACIIASYQQTRFIKTEAINKLTAIRDLKAEQVNNWLDEKIGDIRTTAEIPSIQALSVFRGKTGWSEQADILRRAASALASCKENYKDYEELFIINPVSGQVEISTNQSMIGADKSNSAYFTEPMRTNQLHIEDIHFSKEMHRPVMALSIPIHSRESGDAIVGILVVGIDPKFSIFDLFLKRTGLGKTGETLIVNRNRMALIDLRWYDNAPLRLQIHAKPSVLAAQGKTGVVEAADYRGEEVLAAFTHIPRLQWGFVAKMDQREIYESIPVLYRNMAVLFLLTMAVAVLISNLLARKISQPVLAMSAVARKIQEGDLTARNRIEAEDELGFLAAAFNTMAAAVNSRMSIQNETSQCMELMVDITEIKTFARAIIQKLMEVTGSDLGVYYQRRPDQDHFEPAASIGVRPELLQPINAVAFEGEPGRVLLTHQIQHIREIPADTIFTLKTSAGDILPKEIITIPIQPDHRIRAVISLANIRAYSPESLEIIKQIRPALNTALSNLLAITATRELSKELENKNEELTAQADELKAQTVELKAQSEQLQQQNVELDIQGKKILEADRLKSEFLSNMSHELRTPLNSIMALSRVLSIQAEQKLSQDECNYLEIIGRNGRNLLALINDILDLAKIEAGRMEVTQSLFSINAMIEGILERLEPLALEKGITLQKELPQDFPMVTSDEMRVHQILQNLIGNAVKFTTQGHVTVTGRHEPQEIAIQVKDTGIGITLKDLPYIFDEFRQVDGSSARRFEGTGLGLAIAYKAARLLGGNLSVASTPGIGSVFTLTLPLHQQAASIRHEPSAVGSKAAAAPSGIKKVLVVDDETATAHLVSDYLISEGYDTLIAGSGKKALELAALHRPFAITLDILMPDLDGWEVLQRLKDNEETKDIPVIIISVADDQATGLALGATGYITKPIQKEILLQEIRTVSRKTAGSIMIVDDDPLEREEVATLLKAEGLRVISLENGAQCLNALENSLPDVLLLDLMMPEMDGFEVLNQIRSRPETIDLPVIVLTAKDLTLADRYELSGRVAAVLEKSATPSSRLLAAIKDILVSLNAGDRKPTSAKKPAAPRILLVEDNEAAVIQIQTMLAAEGFHVDVAKGGGEAMEYVRQTLPDGIILDLMMPGVDGFTVLESIRATPQTAQIPVLILTAKDLSREDLGRLSANHIQQLVQKGDVDRKDLLFKVGMMLGSKPRQVVRKQADKPPADGTQVVEKKEPADPMSVKRPAILIVEDNADNLLTIKAVLGDRYQYLEASDGEQGLQLALTETPDLILLDMALPKMDGHEVIRRIRRHPAVKGIPVVALTARAMKGDREIILAEGCDDYVSKPIDPEGLEQKIARQLERKSL